VFCKMNFFGVVVGEGCRWVQLVRSFRDCPQGALGHPPATRPPPPEAIPPAP